MISRTTDDRRVKKINVPLDKRKGKRRQEDKDNFTSYYGVLGLSIAIFAFISIISFIWGR